MFTRRVFLRASAVAMAGVGSAPAWLVRTAAQTSNKRKILRPTIAIPAPGKTNGAIDLDGRFGLHPALQLLKPLWADGHLAIVEAAGSPDPSRSHFDAQDFMESGTPGKLSEAGA